MKFLRWIIAAFSLYSKIPMPRVQTTEEDMSYALAFFPLVGLVIGGVTFGLQVLARFLELPVFVKNCICILIPILLTGGFHLDGFMDTSDALHSYREREEKLRIMKDPHCGAFAVISLAAYLIALGGALYLVVENGEMRLLAVLATTFVISRSLSGISALFFQKAKEDGMLVWETANKHPGVVIALIVSLVLAAAFAMIPHPLAGTAVFATFGVTLLSYGAMSEKQFGGVSGDTAGGFVVVSEGAAAVALAIVAFATV